MERHNSLKFSGVWICVVCVINVWVSASSPTFFFFVGLYNFSHRWPAWNEHTGCKIVSVRSSPALSVSSEMVSVKFVIVINETTIFQEACNLFPSLRAWIRKKKSHKYLKKKCEIFLRNMNLSWWHWCNTMSS